MNASLPPFYEKIHQMETKICLLFFEKLYFLNYFEMLVLFIEILGTFKFTSFLLLQLLYFESSDSLFLSQLRILTEYMT